MGLVKGFVLLTSLAVAGAGCVPAQAAPNKEALKAMLEKCSREADAKGLNVKAGKTAERKEFRRGCMKKMGVEAKS